MFSRTLSAVVRWLQMIMFLKAVCTQSLIIAALGVNVWPLFFATPVHYHHCASRAWEVWGSERQWQDTPAGPARLECMLPSRGVSAVWYNSTNEWYSSMILALLQRLNCCKNLWPTSVLRHGSPSLNEAHNNFKKTITLLEITPECMLPYHA